MGKRKLLRDFSQLAIVGASLSATLPLVGCTLFNRPIPQVVEPRQRAEVALQTAPKARPPKGQDRSS